MQCTLMTYYVNIETILVNYILVFLQIVPKNHKMP